MEQAIDKDVLARMVPDPGIPDAPPVTDNAAGAARKHQARLDKEAALGVVHVDPLTRYVTRIKKPRRKAE